MPAKDVADASPDASQRAAKIIGFEQGEYPYPNNL